MSQANDLLMTLTAGAGSGAAKEGHIIIGADRFITVPDSLRKIGVQYDHNVETLTFDCPRYWDEHDMSTMNIYVDYVRADGECGKHLCENVTVDGDIMHFDWKISGHVTAEHGNIAFLVCIKKADAEGNEQNHWNSEVNTDLIISQGMETFESISVKYPDIIGDLLNRMGNVEGENEAWKEETYDALNDHLEANEKTAKSYMEAASKSATAANTSATNATQAAEDAAESLVGANEALNRSIGIAETGVFTATTTEKDLLGSKVGALKIDAAYGQSYQQTYSGKNLLKLEDVSKTYAGVSFVSSAKNGTIIANGTASEQTTFNTNVILDAGTYILSGDAGGGSLTTHSISYAINDSWLGIHETGNGVEFTITEQTKVTVGTVIRKGYTANNLVFKPMISVEGGEFEPYVGGIPAPNPDYPQEILTSGANGSEKLTPVGENLIPHPYYETGHTDNGVVWTDLGDGRVMANGTASTSADSTFYLRNDLSLEAGTYFLSGCPHGGSASGYRIQLANNSWSITCSDMGSGAKISLNEKTTLPQFRILIPKGMTVSNLVFKPSIRLVNVEPAVEVKTIGKNILDPAWFLQKQTTNGMSITNNGDNTWTFSGERTDASGSTGMMGLSFTADNTPEQFKKVGAYKLSLITPSDFAKTSNQFYYVNLYYNGTSHNNWLMSGTTEIAYITEEMLSYEDFRVSGIGFYLTSGRTFKTGTIGVQIEYSETATDFEPYKESTTLITIPNDFVGIPVASGGNYTDNSGQQWICDEIVKYADGSGKHIKRFKRIVYDGVNLAFNAKSSSTTNNIFYADRKTEDFKSPVDNKILTNIISSHFTRDINGNGHGYNGSTPCVYGSAGFINIYFGFGIDSEITTVALANEWLKSNNVVVYYELAEPIITDLTPEQLSDLRQLDTYDTSTHIFTDAAVDPIIKCEYALSTVGGHALRALIDSEENTYRIEKEAAELTDRMNEEIEDLTVKIEEDIEAAKVITLSGKQLGSWKSNSVLSGGIIPPADYFTTVAYGDGQYIYMTNGGIGCVSTDCKNWTIKNGVAGVKRIAYGNGKFVAVGESGKIYYWDTANAMSWTSALSAASTIIFNDVTYGNGKFIAVGVNNGTGIVYYSANGTSWTAASGTFANELYGVTYGNGKFVAVGHGGITYYSYDGITWTAGVKLGNGNLTGVVCGNDKFVAIGASEPYVYFTAVSYDGVNWSTVCSGSSGGILWRITYGNGVYIAVGDGGSLITSNDGYKWTTVTTNTTTSLRDIVYGNGKFVYVGGDQGTFESLCVLKYAEFIDTTITIEQAINELYSLIH